MKKSAYKFAYVDFLLYLCTQFVNDYGKEFLFFDTELDVRGDGLVSYGRCGVCVYQWFDQFGRVGQTRLARI